MYRDVRYWSFSWAADPPPGYRYKFGEDDVNVLNPLHARILVARTLANLHAGELAAAGVSNDDPYTIGDILTAESHLLDAPAESRLTKLERDAVAAACDDVHARSETIVYLNDFARLKHGFDIVAKEADGERRVYIEVKGTFSDGKRGATARLKTTLHKGRQLSHRWIWRSVQETALFSASASFFLRNARQTLQQSYVRRLVVVSLGAETVRTVSVEESELASRAGLSDASGIDQSKEWLAEIDREIPELI